MRCARSQLPVLQRPPKREALPGLLAARAVLEEAHAPMSPDELAQLDRALAMAPYRKRQQDLALVLPEPDVR